VRVEEQIRYSATPDRVAAMLADPEFAKRKCAATGALSYDADVVGDASGAFTVTTRRTLPTLDVPDFARKFTGETVDVRQVEAWEAAAADGSRAGSVVVELIGTPVRMTGTLRLERDGEGTRELIDGDLKAGIPLLGGKLEQAAAPAFVAAIRKEQEVGTGWLAAG
jgi:carbon monoxide dehydrogenase subunit G